MSRSGVLEGAPMVQGEQTEWPRGKLILAFIVGLLLLSPAILGIYWEWLLP
jgi:hypothetical protein